MEKKTYKKWSKSEEKRMVTMWKNGLPVKELSKALGRTSSSVNNRLAKINSQVEPRVFLDKETPEPEEKGLFARLLNLWRSGK